jgi:uncharacterized protein YkwD
LQVYLATLDSSLTEPADESPAPTPKTISPAQTHLTTGMQIVAKTRTLLLILFALAILVFAAPCAFAQAASPDEQTLLRLANQFRVQHNIPPLHWDNSLARAARAHLQWVVRNPGQLLHQYSGEPDLVTRGANADARFATISENLAANGDSPAALHQAWTISPTHRANLLDPNLNSVGIAVAENHGLFFAVTDFGRYVVALTPDTIEHQVAKLLQAQGIPPAPSNEDARKTCTMVQGQAGTPKLVIQWDGADISQLPDNVLHELHKTRYTSAAVGACAGEPSNPQFTTYHIAILLY